MTWCASFEATIAELGSVLGQRRSLWITTPAPRRLHEDAFFAPAQRRLAPVGLRVLECSERAKTFDEVQRVCRWAQEAELGRNAVLVSIGGGVSSDIVTMAASLLRRGIAHVRVPTTLLAAVDAAIGAKGAVNFGNHKNSLGCFHPPESVLLTPHFLSTLPARHLRSGLGEVLKVAMAVDAGLFEALERDGAELVHDPLALGTDRQLGIVWRAAVRMLDELEPNLFETKTLARTMDLGHTFSPLLEVAAEYRLTHGEAVAIDLVFTAAVSHELGLLDGDTLERVLRLVKQLGLVRHHPLLDLGLCEAAIDESIRHRGGDFFLFVPTNVGRVQCLRDRALLTRAVLERSLARQGELRA